jgi:hypothetical protein
MASRALAVMPPRVSSQVMEPPCLRPCRPSSAASRPAALKKGSLAAVMKRKMTAWMIPTIQGSPRLLYDALRPRSR